VECYTASNQNPTPKVIIVEKDGVNNIFVEGIINERGVSMANTSVTIGDGNSFSGNIMIASILNNCNTSISTMKSENDKEEKLKQKMMELKEFIDKLCIELPDDKGEQVANDMDNIAKEVTSKKPRKSHFELFANGILEAAKCCYSLVGPITQAIKDVMSLVGNFT
jgi:hypothetical protein